MSPELNQADFASVQAFLRLNPASAAAYRNEQYYEAILSIWNQLYINAKSLIAWQYCILDIKRINSLTISMVRGKFTHRRSSWWFLSPSRGQTSGFVDSHQW